MLIGPREQWIADGQQWTTEVPRVQESAYPLPIVDADILTSRDAGEAAIGRPGQLILDVRSEAEYSGERFWPSGATAVPDAPATSPAPSTSPSTHCARKTGRRRASGAATHLRGRGVTKDKSVITYCTIGNRASEAWFELSTSWAIRTSASTTSRGPYGASSRTAPSQKSS